MLTHRVNHVLPSHEAPLGLQNQIELAQLRLRQLSHATAPLRDAAREVDEILWHLRSAGITVLHPDHPTVRNLADATKKIHTLLHSLPASLTGGTAALQSETPQVDK